ncbi:MAG: hypothetical protein PHO41_09345 [Eubacteriales bacterium]|nr:hypothetical protein [Eubacteriales bacterium]
MCIKNLAQLKRALQPGVTFTYIRHSRPERIGETMVVNACQSKAVYLQVHNQPDHYISKANGGRGSWMPYSKAPFYRFGKTVACYGEPGNNDSLIFEFRVNESVPEAEVPA